jgi:hypothetical protein
MGSRPCLSSAVSLVHLSSELVVFIRLGWLCYIRLRRFLALLSQGLLQSFPGIAQNVPEKMRLSTETRLRPDFNATVNPHKEQRRPWALLHYNKG